MFIHDPDPPVAGASFEEEAKGFQDMAKRSRQGRVGDKIRKMNNNGMAAVVLSLLSSFLSVSRGSLFPDSIVGRNGEAANVERVSDRQKHSHC
jgi:hypothetical protein